jgi:DNA (cytosine-5)-methyltransferase 1
MLAGNAKGYVKQIINLFEVAGYNVQLFLLNAASMGVPQQRERVFFICSRKDLNLPNLKLQFSQIPISVKEAFERIKDINYKGKLKLDSEPVKKYWIKTKPGESFSKYHQKGSFFNWIKIPINVPCKTIDAHPDKLFHYESPRNLSKPELCVLGSYPLDYEFKNEKIVGYLIGMSVPPLMTYAIAKEIYKQWLNVIK